MPDPNSSPLPRRQMLLASAAALGGSALPTLGAAAASADAAADKVYRIGVVSASIHGNPQPRNGHTWHFAQYLHPTIDFDAFQKLYPPQYPSFKNILRNPRLNFDLLPFPDTKITHYYDADPKVAADFAAVFPGVQVATSLDEMVKEVDAVWMGDASGFGEDHFDLVAPGLAKGLPTFCDKPIGGTVAGTRQILEFAREHKAPIMSSSLFRHEYGMEAALRKRDSGEFGPIEYVSAALHSRYAFNGWMIYGQHPVWTVMTLLGPGVDAVSLYEYTDTCHGMITYKDRYPAHVWYGQPYEKFEYCRTDVHFRKKFYQFTPSIEGSFDVGHHYEMFRMADAFRGMVKTGVEPVPHQEILEVTAIIHAGAKSLQERSRLVELAEVMA